MNSSCCRIYHRSYRVGYVIYVNIRLGHAIVSDLRRQQEGLILDGCGYFIVGNGRINILRDRGDDCGHPSWPIPCGRVII